jgi:excisionase family DNA binding protein
MGEQLLTPDQVAERLQMSKLTIMDYLRKGKLKGIKFGRLWRIKEEALEEFIKEREVNN